MTPSETLFVCGPRFQKLGLLELEGFREVYRLNSRVANAGQLENKALS